ncbi:MAG: cytochrome c biogenesis protein CcdA [Bacteroidales bacterium]
MKSLFTFNLLAVLLLFTGVSKAQIQNPVSWTKSIEKLDGDVYRLVFKAKIDDGWKIYATKDMDGPIKTSVNFEGVVGFSVVDGSLKTVPDAKWHMDPVFEAEVGYFKKEVTITQDIKVEKSTKVSGYVQSQACNDNTCIAPSDEEFSFDVTLEGGSSATPTEASSGGSEQSAPAVSGDTQKDESSASVVPVSSVDVPMPETSESYASRSGDSSVSSKSYWGIFILSFLGGLVALLTPCVFPMIPVTVSYFTKRAGKSKGIRDAMLYGVSIIFIYVVVGLAIARIFGPDALNAMSTDPIFNVIFFILFIVFALSFLGAFELIIPSSWINKADKQADKGGFIGIFFMAFVLALVSFSCTGPIVGPLLVESFKGGILAPGIGMFGFSLALAIPFVLFAIFPSWLNSLPKSGGWMNSVKVVLGFIELALAFKFLSNADLVLQAHLLEREVFLAIWIAIALVLGIYLLGKIRLSHDSPTEKIGTFRVILAVFVFSFVVYMVPGLNGAKLKLLAGFPPPITYSENYVADESNLPEGAHMGPAGIVHFTDYETGMKYAISNNKPAMIDFTGHACVNCRKMETNVWTDARVSDILRNDVVVISLYVDERTKLATPYESTANPGTKIRTVGNKWSEFQQVYFHTNEQPYYVLLDKEGKWLNSQINLTDGADPYLEWLNKGIQAYKKK